MPVLAAEAGAEERPHDLGGDLNADYPSAHAEDVDLVVLEALVRGVRVVDRRGPDAGDLARRDGDPGT